MVLWGDSYEALSEIWFTRPKSYMKETRSSCEISPRGASCSNQGGTRQCQARSGSRVSLKLEKQACWRDLSRREQDHLAITWEMICHLQRSDRGHELIWLVMFKMSTERPGATNYLTAGSSNSAQIMSLQTGFNDTRPEELTRECVQPAKGKYWGTRQARLKQLWTQEIQ